MSRSAAAQASLSVSRTMKCRRMPNRSVRPAPPLWHARRRSLRQEGRGLAPAQIEVHMLGSDIEPHVRRAAEIERQVILNHGEYPAGILHAVIGAVVVHGFPAHEPAPDGDDSAPCA